jgi:hypothetical protein
MITRADPNMKAFDDDVWSMRARKRAMWRKRRWHAALFLSGLGLMGLMIWLAMIGSMWLAVLFGALLMGLALLVVYGVWRTIAKGELAGRFGSITNRNASPISFWFQIAIYMAIAAFLFFSGLALLGVAPSWFTAMLRSMHH